MEESDILQVVLNSDKAPFPLFAQNFSRLIGMHGLNSKDASRLLDVSPQTMSSWLRSRSEPATSAIRAISNLFEFPANRLFEEPFSDLLDVLADRDRYERVESRIRGK